MRSHDDVLGVEQVRATYSHLPLTLSVNVINSVLLAFVLAPVVTASKIIIWTSLVIALSGIRIALWYVHRGIDGQTRYALWTHLATVGSLASGFLWGSAALAFSSVDDMYRLFIALVIGGMCAGAATVHAACFPCVLLFIAPATAPLAANFFLQGSRLQVVAGVMICIFGISLCIASLRFRRWFRATTSARLLLAEQATAIQEANARLTAEIDNHRTTEAKLLHARRQVEHQLAEIGKTQVIGQLAGGIAHDFNNVLGIILGNLELMQPFTDGNAEAEDLRTDALSGALHGAELTRQLLAFARRQPLNPRATNVNALIQSIAKMVERLLTDRIELCLKLDPTVGWALIDQTQLEAALINLLSNAREAMPHGGMITIATQDLHVAPGAIDHPELESGDYLVVEVADTGSGIPESIIDKIFDPFFTTKEKLSGSGLGLSMVFGFVKQSGGHVSVRSSPGVGTMFNLYLPHCAAGEGPGQLRPTSSELDLARKPETVLVVDDNAEMRRIAVRQLVDLGYRVLQAQNASTARTILEHDDTVAVLLSDIAMPGDMDGIGLVQWATGHRPKVSTILTSGYASSGSGRELRVAALGCRFLRKPFRRHELARLMREAVDQLRA